MSLFSSTARTARFRGGDRRVDAVARLAVTLASDGGPPQIARELSQAIVDAIEPELVAIDIAAADPVALTWPDDARRPDDTALPVDDPTVYHHTSELAANLRLDVLVLARHKLDSDDVALLEALSSVTALAVTRHREIHDRGAPRASWRITEALPVAIALLDQDGRIRYANEPLHRILGHQGEALEGQSWFDLTLPTWAAGLSRLPLHPDQPTTCSDGPLHLHACAKRVDGVQELVVVLQDRSEIESLHEQLQQSAKLSAMGGLIAGVAHELNNPLASVVGFADFLSELRDVPPNLREPLAVIREESERASSIVRNLLSFARKTDGQRTTMRLDTLLESTLALLKTQLMSHRVEARLAVEPDVPPLTMDASKMQQVFVNLITNAAQAMDDAGISGTIDVDVVRAGDMVNITVADSGPGIPADVAARIFEPFFTTKSGTSGTGLGLSISHGIVKEHGGRIFLEPRETAGAAFTVQLPIDEQTTPAPLPPDSSPDRTMRSLRVIVVDDEPHILHYMRSTLEAWGHSVQVATDGEEALQLVLAGGHDIIISDLRMQRLGGRELYQQVLAVLPDFAPRIFFSTGDTVRGDTLTFLEGLERPWLNKPFALAELRALLSAASRVVFGRDSRATPIPADLQD